MLFVWERRIIRICDTRYLVFNSYMVALALPLMVIFLSFTN